MPPPSNFLTDDEAAAGWRLLFDGETLAGWRGYRRDSVPTGWRAEEGTLHFAPGGDGGDIVTLETFGSFELALDWKVAPGGNSGIFYWGQESHPAIWHTAIEMQVLDDSGHADAATPSHRAGAVYDLYAPPEGIVHPAGEWNSVRIVADGPHAEHWLNGTRVADFEHDSSDWKRRVAASKFAAFPDFARVRHGLIGLQDHGDPVWYRNVKIRTLT